MISSRVSFLEVFQLSNEEECVRIENNVNSLIILIS